MRTGTIAFLATIVGLIVGPPSANALTVTADTNATDLINALVPNQSQFTSLTGSYMVGNPSQVGTYSGFSSPPVTIGDGITLSTGEVIHATSPQDGAYDLTNDYFGGPSTPEIDAYAPGHVTNFQDANDAAKFQLNFTLATASAVSFQFIFGSVEYPTYTSDYTDAAYVFLDGSQIAFDSDGNPVQVGGSFASLVTTGDTNTTYSDPHGLFGPLTTTSETLSAGPHVIDFEIADTNDAALNSQIFLSDFTTTTNDGGPVTAPTGQPEPTGPTGVPEPASLVLLVIGARGAGSIRRMRPAV